MAFQNETRQRVTGGLEDMSTGVDPSSIPQKVHVAQVEIGVLRWQAIREREACAEAMRVASVKAAHAFDHIRAHPD